ncbi:hypothetical protein BMT54_12055 [Pasteurellaceae bacterium 15-036681]|nr:hypothetical protein BMT54_12055 [Pasteurellaceae bacterium 15-036681]
MKYFFDKKSNAFLVEGIHTITTDAITVTAEFYEQAIEARASGAEIYVESGEVRISAPRPSPYHERVGRLWQLKDSGKQAQLLAQRVQVRKQINAKRDECVNGGVYVHQIDKWVDTDEKGQANLVQIKADFDLNGKEQEFSLICADNSVYQLNYESFKAVWNAVRELKTKMFENAYMHKILLEQNNNPLEYDWSLGWAKTYEETINE